MPDRTLVLSMLQQIEEALHKVAVRAARFQSAEELTASPAAVEAPDAISMLLVASGDALRKSVKIRGGSLLSQHPDIDWKGVRGFKKCNCP